MVKLPALKTAISGLYCISYRGIRIFLRLFFDATGGFVQIRHLTQWILKIRWGVCHAYVCLRFPVYLTSKQPENFYALHKYRSALDVSMQLYIPNDVAWYWPVFTVASMLSNSAGNGLEKWHGSIDGSWKSIWYSWHHIYNRDSTEAPWTRIEFYFLLVPSIFDEGDVCKRIVFESPVIWLNLKSSRVSFDLNIIWFDKFQIWQLSN